jgi:hypothetical protein
MVNEVTLRRCQYINIILRVVGRIVNDKLENINLPAICEPIVLKMLEPRRLTTLWASTAGYRDSFTLYFKEAVVSQIEILSRRLPGGNQESNEVPH